MFDKVSELLASRKDVDIENIAKLAVTDNDVLNEVVKGTLSLNDIYRYNCFKTILDISEKNPQVLYPKWGFFEDMLDMENSYFKTEAVHIIANLTKVDEEKRFEKIFDKYFALLNGDSVMLSGHLAKNAGKIARYKPFMEKQITDIMLGIDEQMRDVERRDLIKSYIIEAFTEYYENSGSREKIVGFVQKQLGSKSQKTKKLAKAFLKNL